MFLFSASKPSAGGGGGDWLGLGGGDDDGGLDLNNVPLKTSTPFPRESKKDVPSTQGTFFCSFYCYKLLEEHQSLIWLLFAYLYLFNNF